LNPLLFNLFFADSQSNLLVGGCSDLVLVVSTVLFWSA
jgi:hypothetical protein